MGLRTVLTGLPGAWLNHAAKHFRACGSITWPGQNEDLRGFQQALNDGENLELRRMHSGILAQTGQSWFTTQAPRWWDTPFPGPREYLAQFDGEGVILTGNAFCFFLPMWAGLIDQVVVVDIDFDESIKACHRWANGEATLDSCRDVAHHYQERLMENLAGREVHRISQAAFS